MYRRQRYTNDFEQLAGRKRDNASSMSQVLNHVISSRPKKLKMIACESNYYPLMSNVRIKNKRVVPIPTERIFGKHLSPVEQN